MNLFVLEEEEKNISQNDVNQEKIIKKLQEIEEEISLSFIEYSGVEILEDLKPIYEYYQKISETLKNNKQRLDMLEELVDEMITEVIREDMKKNNVTLPKFVKGMKYFKHENEE